MRLRLSAGQRHDITEAHAMMNGLDAEVVIADTAFDADHLREAVAARGMVCKSLD